MSEHIHFTSNYADHSTNKGFQFEFHCDRCQSGYKTKFKGWAMGSVTGLLDSANSIFGGIFGKAAEVGNQLRDAKYERAKEEAMQEAVKEIMPDFIQCKRCMIWVCRKQCYNTTKGLCKNCAPDLGVEIAAAQSAKAVEAVWENATPAEEEKVSSKDFKNIAKATCPNCGVAL